MNDRRQRYDIYLSTGGGYQHAAQAVLQESDGRLIRMDYRYTPGFQATGFPLDPSRMPVTNETGRFDCLGGCPGILDDYLPDAWGRKVLTTMALYRDGFKLSRHSVIDTLSLLGHSRAGALVWVVEGAEPTFGVGAPLSSLKQAELASQHIDAPETFSEVLDELSLMYLANNGSGVGGARPKALIEDGGELYLAKFNRLHGDAYNNAKVELACLRMAKAAGLNVRGGRIEQGINGRDVLLLERFDIESGGRREHMITVNALLKEQGNQADPGVAFRYDDIQKLVCHYSDSVQDDLESLAAAMLFNAAINNTDDHERNFSFFGDTNGYRLTPSYDMVPSLTTGSFHAAGYLYQPSPPTPGEVLRKNQRLFGLSVGKTASIAEQIIEAISHWGSFSEQVGLSEEEAAIVQRSFKA
jgi:serine/threonine-protein kinase HipA